MKLKIAMALTFASLIAGPAFADTVNFAGGGVLGTSALYDSGNITAYGFNSNVPTDLYGKGTANTVGAEDGLGISGTTDNEITSTSFIQLDLTKISDPFSLTIGSTQGDEGFNVCFSNTLGTLGTSCTDFSGSLDNLGNPDTTSIFTKPAGDQFVSIQADGNPSNGNVLLNELTTSPAAAPEPSSLLMLGTGIIGAAGFIRKRFAA